MRPGLLTVGFLSFAFASLCSLLRFFRFLGFFCLVRLLFSFVLPPQFQKVGWTSKQNTRGWPSPSSLSCPLSFCLDSGPDEAKLRTAGTAALALPHMLQPKVLLLHSLTHVGCMLSANSHDDCCAVRGSLARALRVLCAFLDKHGLLSAYPGSACALRNFFVSDAEDASRCRFRRCLMFTAQARANWQGYGKSSAGQETVWLGFVTSGFACQERFETRKGGAARPTSCDAPSVLPAPLPPCRRARSAAGAMPAAGPAPAWHDQDGTQGLPQVLQWY